MPPSPSNQRASGSERNDTVDLFRVIAICGVIWFHFDNVPWRLVGYAGLVFFLTTSVIFQKSSAERAGGVGFFLRRASRLLIPWVAWFLFYALYNIAVGKRLFPYSTGVLQNILTGPWIGLWYLPFSFLSTSLVYALMRSKIVRNNSYGYIFFTALSLLSLILVVWSRSSGFFATPWSQWIQAAPSLPIGLAMAYAMADPKNALKQLALLQCGVFAVCVGLFTRDSGIALSYGIGSFLVTLGFTWRSCSFSPLAKLGSLCLGVYLVHGFVMSGFKLFPWVTQSYSLWFILTVVISFVITAIIKRIPLLKVIV